MIPSGKPLFVCDSVQTAVAVIGIGLLGKHTNANTVVTTLAFEKFWLAGKVAVASTFNRRSP